VSTLCGFRVSAIYAKDFTNEEKKKYKKNNSKANTRKNKSY
jgi:hypothetical protein